MHEKNVCQLKKDDLKTKINIIHRCFMYDMVRQMKLEL